MRLSFVLSSLAFLTIVSGQAPSHPPYCGNHGLQYAAYKDPETPDEPDDDYEPNSIQGKKYLVQPRIHRAYDSIYLPGNTSSVWGSVKQVSTDFIVINQIGYIYAPTTGTYTFNTTSINDAQWIWLGPYAYSGWNKDNANYYVSIEKYYPNSFEYEMVAGRYYPYRMVFLNSYGVGYFNLSITSDRGKPLSTAQLVYFSCDGTTAPIFPDYNKTTTAS